MAEEQSQRPYRASEPPLRSHARTSNNDPLAELARLIGQTDPFGEFGRDTARRSAAPAERSDWNTATDLPTHRKARPIGAGRQRRGPKATVITTPEVRLVSKAVPADYDGDQSMDASHMAGQRMPTRDDAYQADHEARGYPSGQTDYQYGTYEQDAAQHLEDEYYDQAPSSRRRVGVYGDCRRICFGFDWHRRRVRISRLVWLLRVPPNRRPLSKRMPGRAKLCQQQAARTRNRIN